MQIEVRDGSRILWVEEFACFFDNGELAFSDHELPDLLIPDWFGAPEESVLRVENRKSKDPEFPNEELRSMRGTATDVVSFYRERVLSGGLTLTENPVVDHAMRRTDLSRIEPGFYAENDDYRLSLDVYKHGELVFWRVQHGPKLRFGFRSKKEPKHLVLVGEGDKKVILRNPDTNNELWAPSSALTEGPPDHAQYPKRKRPEEIPISWALVPAWLQFDIALGTDVRACSSRFGGASAGFSCMTLASDIRTGIDRLLDQLNTFSFDATGARSPDHSYYLEPMTGGRHIIISVNEKSGDRTFLTFVDTRREPVLYAHYQTKRTLEEFLARS